MARFFIDRPIFAWVLAIVVMLAGALSILTLPVAQYPAIAPPTIAINASYPGASAKTVEGCMAASDGAAHHHLLDLADRHRRVQLLRADVHAV